jgi:hypothetical protein
MRSMDRLLRHFLSRFIRRGSITFTTSYGAAFTCGDGTGQPVSVRFLTAEAERHLLLDPELAIGEIYTDGNSSSKTVQSPISWPSRSTSPTCCRAGRKFAGGFAT